MRAELLHPLLVHFPLALLLLGAALRLFSFLLRKHRQSAQITRFASWYLLVFGVLFAWLAVIAGGIAEDIVRDSLCTPSTLETHGRLAYAASSLFTAAVLLDLLRSWKKTKFLNSALAASFMAILYAAATTLIVLTGGFGADLVFKQGAAVEKKCTHPL